MCEGHTTAFRFAVSVQMLRRFLNILSMLLQEALKLSWKSSTKLLIHFGDAPAHGRQYHDGGVTSIFAARYMFGGGYDLYPDGDPNGNGLHS